MPALMMATPAGGVSRGGDGGHHHPPGPPGPGGEMHRYYEQHQDFMTYEDQEELRRLQDLETLRHIIAQWNANRLDLFELSMPNENLEFHGVMRFYYQAQDLASGQKVATKCIRVSSQATTKSIIETLIEKFRPDMKMLEMPEYALYEIHESGERRLGLDEKPLLVQLNWHKDDREGRFLLRRIDEASQMPATTQEDSSFKRKLSKREKKGLKKAEKAAKAAGKTGEKEGGVKGGDESSMAEKLYSELPDTSFTRSISNPEAVMRRRRQQKLEKKLQQFRSKDGGPDTGGTLKIYGDALCKDVPYKTLLLSINDTAMMVVNEMLDKYGLNRADAANFCLVQANSPHPVPEMDMSGRTSGEYVLEDDECPLAILMNHQAQANRGAITFHVRRRYPDGSASSGRKKKSGPMPQVGRTEGGHLPFLVELPHPQGPGGHSMDGSRIIRLKMTVTEIGSDVASSGGIQLPGLLRRHCVIAHTDGGVVTVTPFSPAAEVLVNGQRIVETTILKHRSVLQFGGQSGIPWQFVDPIAAAAEESRTMSGSLQQLPSAVSGSVGGPAGYPNNMFPPNQQPQGKDAILPAVLEFREDTESAFFNALTVNLDPSSVNFKLAPTYTLYMATRFRASTHYRPELVPEERAVKLTDMLNRVADKILRLLATPPGANHAPTLSFWMGNSSELLHFLKSDRHITAFSLQAQDMLADAVHMAFKQLVLVLQSELETVLPSLLSDRDEDVESTTMGILNLFTNTMGLLRKCRVNAALTIQLFSQLFHFVNMWTFNLVVSDKNKGMYCTHKWGLRLKRRLSRIEIWAEKQGLELAADCHLARIMQTAHLLQARKSTAEDIATLSSTCFKLNSVQLRYLLSHYQPADAEAPISTELIDTIVRVAENTVDELTRSEGRQVRLEEDFVLQLPFLLPEDNYSCDIIRGVPAGLFEFLAPLQNAGLCVMTPQPTSSGHWTIYMDNQVVGGQSMMPPPRSPSEMSTVDPSGGPVMDQSTTGMMMMGSSSSLRSSQVLHPPPANNNIYSPEFGAPPPGHPPGSRPLEPPRRISPSTSNIPHHLPEQPEVITIRLAKTNGMGLSIVAAKGMGQDRLGIYIKAVVEGGAAWQDGRLAAGDQLLSVDGHSLVGITQEHAADIMMRTGTYVTLEVARQGAIYHGLATLLSQPSPVVSRGGNGPPQTGSWQPGGEYGGMSRSASSTMGPPLPQGRNSVVGGAAGPGAGAGGGVSNGMRIPQSKSTPSLHQSDYQNQEWLHQQFTGTAGRPAPPSVSTHPPPPPPLTAASRSSSASVSVADNFYQNLGHPSAGGRHRMGGSQTSLTGSGVGGSSSSGRIGRPASTHFMMSGGQQHTGSESTLTTRPTSASVISSGPEKPIRQYSYEMETSVHQQEEVVTSERPRVRFREDSSPVQEEEPEVDYDQSSTRSQSHSPQPAGTARLDMLLNNNPPPSRHQFGGSSGSISSPPKRVSFQQENSSSTIFSSTSSESKSSVTHSVSGTAVSSRTSRVSFLEQHTTDPSFRGEGEDREEETEGEDNTEPYREVDGDEDRDSPMFDEDGGDPTRVGDTEPRSKMSRDEDPNAFISEAENLLNSATIGVSKLGLSTVSSPGGGLTSTSTTGHTPSVIGTQEVYRDPRQKRLMKQQQEKKMSTDRVPDGSKLSFQEKMKLFAQEAGDNTPREKAKISKAQRDIEDT